MTGAAHKTKNMDFSEALKLLKQGATIRRASWRRNKQIKLIHDDRPDLVLPYIRIVTKDNRVSVYTATNCDILADDWVLLGQYKEVNSIIE